MPVNELLGDGFPIELDLLVVHDSGGRPVRIKEILDGGLCLLVESLGETSTWWSCRTSRAPALLHAQMNEASPVRKLRLHILPTEPAFPDLGNQWNGEYSPASEDSGEAGGPTGRLATHWGASATPNLLGEAPQTPEALESGIEAAWDCASKAQRAAAMEKAEAWVAENYTFVGLIEEEA